MTNLVAKVISFQPVYRRFAPTLRHFTITNNKKANDDYDAEVEVEDESDALQRALAAMNEPKSSTWYMKEEQQYPLLPFSCTGCGKCCKTKGAVHFSPDEVEGAASLLDLSTDEFVSRYASHVHYSTGRDEEKNVPWVRLNNDKSNDGGNGCVFLNDDNMCSIYEARPLQCKTYPFWTNILSSPESWNAEVRRDPNSDSLHDSPQWTPEAGGCEGMQLVAQNGETRQDDNNGVSARYAHDQLQLYERYRKRFPQGNFVEVK